MKQLKWCFWVLVMMSFLLLAGCGGGSDDSKPTPTPTPTFTTAMISGKTFSVYFSYNGGSTRTATFNADKTITPTGSTSITWDINSSGQLILYHTSATNLETDTITLTTATPTILTGSMTWSNSSNSNTGSGTMIFTLVTTAYSLADLNGTIAAHELTASDAPNWFGWYRSDVAVSNGGFSAATYYKSNPHSSGTESAASGEQMSSDGTFTISGYTSFHGTMSKSKSLVVATASNSESEPRLAIWLKKIGIFSTSDLAGTWYTHALQTGDGVGANWWGHMTESITAGGVSTQTLTGDSEGSPTGGTEIKSVTVSSDGTITSTALGSNLHGTINSDKNLFVFTVGDGTIGVSVKTGGTFTQSDLTGTWYWYALGTEDGNNFWFRGDSTINALGVVTFTSTKLSDGTSPAFGSGGATTLSSEGIYTMSGSSQHGVMSSTKDVLVMTADLGTARTLWIGLKR
jgi:hypothetical protein